MKVSKDIRDGWTAVSVVPMDGGRQLRISTSKRHNGHLVTSATSVVPSAYSDSGYTGFSFVMFQDFNQCVITAPVRCTQKSVIAQHAEALASLPELLAQANAHQARVEASKAGAV